ncbi:DUF1656 domain-containing protein [Dyella soli]|uniref:DUF1656 domain-containing protein n=1 Tax=Dyella soli TaxID=522319 RepID=A0A4R0YS23_9GAMM|nr:DUF1656 domain-containing protein [Dyella soli]TCI09658.1 DUF1656 domain-containing protein [Dyella soli]
MMPELNIEGVFIHGAIECAVFAGMSLIVVRKVFGWIGVYGAFLNPGLMDICFFLLLWGGWTCLLSR